VWGQRYIDDLVLRDQSSTRHYVLNDHVNVTSIINTSGTVQERYGYNAFGTSRVMNASFVVQSSSSYNWETRFAAYRWDSESGLYQVRYRYYHPLLGTWINRDPIEEKGGINLYEFNQNNPVFYIDSDGKSPIAIPFPSLPTISIPPAIPIPPISAPLPALIGGGVLIGGFAAGYYIGDQTGFHDWLGDRLANGYVVCMGWRGSKGERNWGKNNNPYKHCREVPGNPEKIVCRDADGKWSKPRPKPSDWDDYKQKP
jgi:RHS repeat-associated protein